MANDWILDVLADLTEFARKGGLPALERQLRATANVARLEIASTQGMMCPKAHQGAQSDQILKLGIPAGSLLGPHVSAGC